ncbi:alpha/beta fold hydrolase [Virgisporangium ochraceum]
MEAIVRPDPRPDASHALVCFSFSGGGTARMRSWARVLPPHVELLLVCYPGREGRFVEPFAADWDALVADAVRVVHHAVTVPYTVPYTVLGHSLGAWVAFEVAVRMGRLGRAPTTVVASASEPPTRWRHKRNRPPTAADTDDELIAWMGRVGQVPAAVLAEPELRAMAVDVLRADIRVSDSYRYRPGVRVDAPIQVLHGTRDHDVDPGTLFDWADLTTASCLIEAVDGGHFYTDEIWASLPTLVYGGADPPTTRRVGSWDPALTQAG